MEPKRDTPEFVQQLLANLDLKKNKKPETDKEIKTDSSSDEDETMDLKAKSTSPTKYFGKRMSFDYHNLKKIEKPILRRQSLLDSDIEALSPSKKNFGVVKFDEKPEEIKNDQGKSENEKQKPQVNKNEKNSQKKSILKNTCFSENLELVKIFLNQEYYNELIEHLNKECGGNSELLREKMPAFFNEFSMKKLNEGGVVQIIKVSTIFNYFFRF